MKHKKKHFILFSLIIDQWEKVIYIVYQYIAMLRKEGPKEWIFEECKVM